MNISFANGCIHVTDVQFDPRLTLLESAQVFHWTETTDNEFSSVISGKTIQLRPTVNGFILINAQKDDVPFWRHYFDLDRDYTAINNSCEAYPVAKQAMELLPGMRVLNQPPWETLLSFIISANNNVSRIRQLIEKLIINFGQNGAFPDPSQLSMVAESELRMLGFGYRAPYLIKTAHMVADGFPLDELHRMPYVEAHRLLLTLPGVGDKVADCVQLFSTGHSEAFPVDVWVERLMKQWFIPDTNGKKEISQKAREMFGSNAGIVQQSLFHCARLKLIPLNETSM